MPVGFAHGFYRLCSVSLESFIDGPYVLKTDMDLCFVNKVFCRFFPYQHSVSAFWRIISRMQVERTQDGVYRTEDTDTDSISVLVNRIVLLSGI